MSDEIESELDAVKVLVQALEPLRPEVRSRVIDHAFKVLGIEHSSVPLPLSHAAIAREVPSHPPYEDGLMDIFTLKETKKPKTANEMVAIVAYYLEHIASERQTFVTQEEVQKYFVQAKYPMPGSKSQALVNAKNAGYLDSIEPGKYRLNSVGYNLVAHKMPRENAVQPKAKKAKRGAKKPAAKRRK
ncbi:hypothetical protein [Bradyrhizobium sp. SZCCHNR1075]|uniref:hypothetical protein n=1 Tax=Bradyrhizobium sp. SZCCHNR1075 TaxID=3057362 RepID=UPI0028EC8E70|nr:hypothetical protein [Bradyrhizobium sp. SZCCHNR1075]